MDPSSDFDRPSAGVPFGGDLRQRVLHNAILAVGCADLLPQLGILRNGDALELGDDQVLRLGQILLELR